MVASLKLCVVFLLLIAVPLRADLENGEVGNAKNKSNFKRLLRFFGLGSSDGSPITQQQLSQFGPCGIPFTTTPAPVGPLCPYPFNGPNGPNTLPVPGALIGPPPNNGPDNRPPDYPRPDSRPFDPKLPNQPNFNNQQGIDNNGISNQPFYPNQPPFILPNRPNFNDQPGYPNLPPNQPNFNNKPGFQPNFPPGKFPQNPGQPISNEQPIQGDGPFPGKPLAPGLIKDPLKYPENPTQIGHERPLPFQPVMVDPSKPNFPSQPVLIDPTKPNFPSQPVMIDPTKPNQPFDPVRPINPSFPNQPDFPRPINPSFPNNQPDFPRPINPSFPNNQPDFPRPINPSFPNQPDFPRPVPNDPSNKPPFIPYPNQPNADNIGQGTSPGVAIGPGPLNPAHPHLPSNEPLRPKPSESDKENPFLRPLPCSAILPFKTAGFSPASVSYFSLPPNKDLKNEPACSTLDTLSRLGANTMVSLLTLSPEVDLRAPGYTFFVPLDAAFKRMPKVFFNSLMTDEKLRVAFLLNHLVREDVPLYKLGNEFLLINARPGANAIRINVYGKDTEFPIYSADGARIIRGDMLTANGRIHLTDKVINPNPPRNAAEYLSERIEFESFWNLVKNSNLEMLKGDHPVTLFIPTNEAMEKIELTTLTKEPHQLRNFIDYHIVNGTYYSAGVINGEYLTTNYNKEIKLGVYSDGFSKSLHSINGYNHVVKSDIPLVNGAVHIIDRCLSEKMHFYAFEESDEFQSEFGVISKRNMKITSDEKNIEDLF